MTRRRIIHCLAAAALLVAAVPAVALGQTAEPETARDERVAADNGRTDNLERAKARIIKQIERRLEALDRLAGKIESARHLTEEHAGALLGDIGAARETLRAGKPAVEAATTPEELREIAPPIFQDTLVFALLVPKTHEVAASDATVAVGARFSQFGGRLQEALNRIAAETDVDTAEAQASLDAMLRLANHAAATGGPVAGNVIDLQPDQWPDPAQQALREGKAALEGARASLREARGLGREVVEFIRSVAGDRPANDG